MLMLALLDSDNCGLIRVMRVFELSFRGNISPTLLWSWVHSLYQNFLAIILHQCECCFILVIMLLET